MYKVKSSKLCLSQMYRVVPSRKRGIYILSVIVQQITATRSK